jgi:DNA polymerase-3 subunit beta
MEIVCSQADLKTNLSLVSRAVPSRPTHPILANVLLNADQEKGRLGLTGFDLSLGIRTSFPAQVSQGGMITIPSKIFNDIVSRLPDGEVTITYEEDEFEDNPIISIKSASGSFQIRGIKAEDYPELPQVGKDNALMLPISALSEGLKGSLFAASMDETKQILTGIHLIREDDTLEFASTDGHRLAIVKTTDQKPTDDDQDNEEDSESEDMEDEDSELDSEAGISQDQNFAITIPARALRELEKIFAMTKESDSMALYVDDGQVVFELGDQHLTSRKLDGTYPNYNQLIPRNFSRTMVIERKRLIESLERVGVLADQKNNMVRFRINSDDDVVTLVVEAKELGTAKESIPVQITGESLEIGFSIRYLMDGLKALPTDDIKMNFNEATQPVVINPLGGLNMTYLIMPVQIRD